MCVVEANLLPGRQHDITPFIKMMRRDLLGSDLSLSRSLAITQLHTPYIYLLGHFRTLQYNTTMHIVFLPPFLSLFFHCCSFVTCIPPTHAHPEAWRRLSDIHGHQGGGSGFSKKVSRLLHFGILLFSPGAYSDPHVICTCPKVSFPKLREYVGVFVLVGDSPRSSFFLTGELGNNFFHRRIGSWMYGVLWKPPPRALQNVVGHEQATLHQKNLCKYQYGPVQFFRPMFSNFGHLACMG